MCNIILEIKRTIKHFMCCKERAVGVRSTAFSEASFNERAQMTI